jgi:hypothetical protein
MWVSSSLSLHLRVGRIRSFSTVSPWVGSSSSPLRQLLAATSPVYLNCKVSMKQHAVGVFCACFPCPGTVGNSTPLIIGGGYGFLSLRLCVGWFPFPFLTLFSYFYSYFSFLFCIFVFFFFFNIISYHFSLRLFRQ